MPETSKTIPRLPGILQVAKWAEGEGGVATGRDVIAAAAGAARGRRCVYMDGRGGRSPCPKYLKTTLSKWPNELMGGFIEMA